MGLATLLPWPISQILQAPSPTAPTVAVLPKAFHRRSSLPMAKSAIQGEANRLPNHQHRCSSEANSLLGTVNQSLPLRMLTNNHTWELSIVNSRGTPPGIWKPISCRQLPILEASLDDLPPRRQLVHIPAHVAQKYALPKVA